MSYIIGSFNMRKFSANTHKDLSAIKRIIEDEEIDILAIQEIFSQNALDKLLDELDKSRKHWDGRWASPDSRSASAAEGYAFLWNKYRIRLAHSRSGKCFAPVIHNQYPHKEFGELIRNPFYGRFEDIHNTMTEIRLINTHIMFSLKREENDSDDHDSSEKIPGAVSMRKREFDILASKILPKLEDKDYDRYWNEEDEICRNPITILLGDYNLNLRSSGAKDSFLETNQELIIIREGNFEKRIVTGQTDLSTLKNNLTNASTEGPYRNNYDHFTYNETRPIEVKCWAVRSPDDPNFFDGDYAKYKKEVSDHLMVVMSFDLV